MLRHSLENTNIDAIGWNEEDGNSFMILRKMRIVGSPS